MHAIAMIDDLNNVEAITVFSDDVAASREFYTAVFAASIVYEDEVSAALRLRKAASNLSTAPLTDRGVAALRCSSDPTGLPWEIAQELS